MVALISGGAALYATIDVYRNFYNHKDGIYSNARGKKTGGHGMVALGYGVQSGTKYWVLQNSWGVHGWGVNGIGKFKRGENLCGIEERAFFIRAWVQGGKVPQCFDAEKSGLKTKSGSIPCSRASKYCSHAKFGGRVSNNCPKTCGHCEDGLTGEGAQPAPKKNKPPPPPPTTTTPPPPVGGGDDASCIKDYTAKFRGKYKCVWRNECPDTLKWKCPSLPCTHRATSGGYKIAKCNGEYQTEICEGKCAVSKL
eukprot:gnl/TRDRNA2_/TRDRNA2_161141_c0_seq2.p1 gnl/TRDRNA2_/TRDRNA2_161141_c0~~gnl/TRDRNA2_/TRDRNA2_161141_c0_seq2.p1  ORF type:complete len:253 (-),score=31.62 gnl/TRDRNA2_/TRDRNA2_161141_c0_seq2:434-1192(-)